MVHYNKARETKQGNAEERQEEHFSRCYTCVCTNGVALLKELFDAAVCILLRSGNFGVSWLIKHADNNNKCSEQATDNGRHAGVSLSGEERSGRKPDIQQIKWVISQRSKKATGKKTGKDRKAGKSRKHFPKFPWQLNAGTKERVLLFPRQGSNPVTISVQYPKSPVDTPTTTTCRCVSAIEKWLHQGLS